MMVPVSTEARERMEDTLKRLLDAELRAEEVVAGAEAEREHLIDQALADPAEAQFEARLPELRASFLGKAEARAAQAVHELERRYAERSRQLREMAQQRESEALRAALELVLDPAREE